MSKRRWSSGNKIELLECGEEFYPALLEAFESAQSEILMDMYTFHDSEIGQKIRGALREAAARGVDVWLVVDGIGSIETPDSFFDTLKDAGVKVSVFRPIRFFPRLRNLLSGRLHRKLVVVDKSLGFVGGINIDDDYFQSHPSGRMDHAVRIRGPVVEDIRETMIQIRRRRWKRWIQKWKQLPFGSSEEASPPTDNSPMLASLLIRDNRSHRKDLENYFFTGLANAKTSLDIATAYFFPGHRFLKELRQAAARGVEIRLLIGGKAEYLTLKWATARLYRKLLQSGVRIFEYEKHILHSKFASIDQRDSTIGSCNLDVLSLFRNYEANILVEDAEFSSNMKTCFEAMLGNAKEVTEEDLERIGYGKRVLQAISYAGYRLLTDLFVIGV